MAHFKSSNELKNYDNKYFIKKPVKGNGDCAYISFLDSMKTLYPDVSIPQTSTELRREVLLFIKSNKTKFANTKEVFNRVESGIKVLGSGWAENEELESLAIMYDVCIAVWSELESVWIYFQHKGIPLNNIGIDGCTRLIYLFNSSNFDLHDIKDKQLSNIYSNENQRHGVHYEYLLPRQSIVYSNTEDDEENANPLIIDDDEEEDEEDDEENANPLTIDDDEVSDDNSDNDTDIDDDDENMNDVDLTESDKKDIQKVKSLSVEKRFEHFKRVIETFDTTQNYEDVQKMLHISKLLKPENNEHRLEGHAEYFVDIKNEYPIDSFTFTKNQTFLKKFLSMDTSNVGLMLFHGVGVGKTCSSILIAENFVNIFENKILVLLPSSLESNYRKELFDMTKLDYENKTYESCSGKRYLDLIPNWTKISKTEINKKVQKMISQEYSFYGYLKIVNVVENIKRKSKEKFGKDDAKRNMFVFLTVRDMFSNRVIIIDEIHNIRLSNEKSMKKFPKILQFILRCSENVRLVLLSATPMFDNPDEISWLMDFLYITDKQYSHEDTSIEFDKKGSLTDYSVKRLQHFSKNYVSYMRGYNPETFPVRYFADSNTFIKNFIHPKKDMISKNKIQPIDMKDYKFVFSELTNHQKKIYQMNDEKEKDVENDIQNKIQLSNIVYPTDDDDIRMSKGKAGFLQNFNVKDSKNLQVSYINPKNEFLSPKQLNKYSSKISNIIESVTESDGLVLIYSKYLYSGIIPCAIALEHLGFNKYNNKNILSKTKTKHSGASYIIITADDSLSPNNVDELNKFNDEQNKKGNNIKVALINEIASEGVTFKNVREIHVLEPWYNMNKIEQIIGRGVRYFSHHALPKEERNVAIYLHINTLKDSDIETIDYRRYRFAIKKQDKINQVENILKENALDCVLNNTNEKSITIKNEMIDSKGKKRMIETEYDNIKCAHKVKPNKSKYTNLRMLLFDTIEVSKQIKHVIEKHALYAFDVKKLNEYFDNDLMENALKHMAKTKMIITIKNVKGYLINNNGSYFFQQKDIDDIKINLIDRKQQPKKYISHFVVSEGKKDKTTTFNTEENVSNDINNTTINEQLDKMFKSFENLLNISFANKSEIQLNLVADMVVDRIPKDLINDIPSIKNERLIDSLKRGNYLILNDKKPVAFYDMYTNYFKAVNNKKKCNLELNDKYQNQVKQHLANHDDDNTLGFIDIVMNKDKTTHEPKSKIKHMDNLKKKKSTFGSACITTSSITINMLKESIIEYDNKLNLEKTKKETLCILYEYNLRKNNKYLRTIEHNLIKN